MTTTIDQKKKNMKDYEQLDLDFPYDKLSSEGAAIVIAARSKLIMENYANGQQQSRQRQRKRKLQQKQKQKYGTKQTTASDVYNELYDWDKTHTVIRDNMTDNNRPTVASPQVEYTCDPNSGIRIHNGSRYDRDANDGNKIKHCRDDDSGDANNTYMIPLKDATISMSDRIRSRVVFTKKGKEGSNTGHSHGSTRSPNALDGTHSTTKSGDDDCHLKHVTILAPTPNDDEEEDKGFTRDTNYYQGIHDDDDNDTLSYHNEFTSFCLVLLCLRS